MIITVHYINFSQVPVNMHFNLFNIYFITTFFFQTIADLIEDLWSLKTALPAFRFNDANGLDAKVSSTDI